MNKNITISISIIVGVILLAAILYGFFGNQKPMFRWNPSFEHGNKQPYGSQLLFERMEDIFAEKPVLISQSPFEQVVYNTQKEVNYLIINDNLDMPAHEVEELVHFVSRGNHLFLAAEEFGSSILEQLNIYQEVKENDTTYIRTVNSYLSFSFSEGEIYQYLHREYGQAVEWLAFGENEDPVFGRIQIGQGYVYLLSSPYILTNYHMVDQENYRLIEILLSVLPEDAEVWWDDYYKPGRYHSSGGGASSSNSPSSPQENESLWDFLMKYPALKWGLWTLVFGIIAYVFFEGKRQQRIVPLIQPLRNTTLDFIHTIGRLYFQTKDHGSLIQKKTRILISWIHRKYQLNTSTLDQDFIKNLAGKSGLEEKEVIQLVRTIQRVQKQPIISESELVEIHQIIETFYQKAGK